jgi:hypothetical protein
MRWTLQDTYDDTQCPVAAFTSTRLRTAESMVTFQDYTKTMPENYVSKAEAVLSVGGVFTPSGIPIGNVPSNFLMVTDIEISGSLTSPNVPMQFQYQPKFDLSTTEPSGAVVLRDERGDVIDPTQYKLQFGNSILNPDGDPARYAAGITWSDNAQSGALNRTRILLSPELGNGDRILKAEYPAYRLDKTVYHSEYVNPVPLYVGNYDYHVSDTGTIEVSNDLAGAGTLYIQRHPDRNVRVLQPQGNETDAWFPKIRIGYFGVGGTAHIQGYQTFQVPNTEPGASGGGLAAVTEYEIPNSIGISPHSVHHSPAVRIDRYTLQVNDTPLLIDVSGVTVDENDGYPWYKPYDMNVAGSGVNTHVGSSGPSGVAIFVAGNYVQLGDIEDWHRDSGLIKLKKSIPHNADIRVSHRYYPIDVKLRSCDMNPGVGYDVWPSGAIRIALTPSGLGWHPLADFPSGVYNPGAEMWSAQHPRTLIDASGAKVLGDYTLNPFTPADIEIHDVRRSGGGLQDKRLNKYPENEHFVE